MEMQFRGWNRCEYIHDHAVTPLLRQENGWMKPGNDGEPLVWNSALTVTGKVRNLGLGGEFRVDFKFTEDELRNWLLTFVRSRPEEGTRLLAEAQGEATIALANQTVDRITTALQESREADDYCAVG